MSKKPSKTVPQQESENPSDLPEESIESVSEEKPNDAELQSHRETGKKTLSIPVSEDFTEGLARCSEILESLLLMHSMRASAMNMKSRESDEDIVLLEHLKEVLTGGDNSMDFYRDLAQAFGSKINLFVQHQVLYAGKPNQSGKTASL